MTIRTNEGLMKRTNIIKRIATESAGVEFDEDYQDGRMVTVKSHYLNQFITSPTGVKHRVAIGDVATSGLMGLFYRAFGKSSAGNPTSSEMTLRT